jgi:hypothetical protein
MKTVGDDGTISAATSSFDKSSTANINNKITVPEEDTSKGAGKAETAYGDDRADIVNDEIDGAVKVDDSHVSEEEARLADKLACFGEGTWRSSDDEPIAPATVTTTSTATATTTLKDQIVSKQVIPPLRVVAAGLLVAVAVAYLFSRLSSGTITANQNRFVNHLDRRNPADGPSPIEIDAHFVQVPAFLKFDAVPLLAALDTTSAAAAAAPAAQAMKAPSSLEYQEYRSPKIARVNHFGFPFTQQNQNQKRPASGSLTSDLAAVLHSGSASVSASSIAIVASVRTAIESVLEVPRTWLFSALDYFKQGLSASLNM